MVQEHGSTTQLQQLLELLRAGDASARDKLIQQACERLRQLAHRMLRRRPDVRRWEQTDDVLQNTLLRLHRSLAKIKPDSVGRFFGLAAEEIRRELIDLARHHFGPEGSAAHHATDIELPAASGRPAPRHEPADAAEEPGSMAEWTEFHQQVEALPPEEQEVVNLLYYQGVTQAEAAAILGLSERTLKRRWQSARLLLKQRLSGE